jgi:hypothetical protein
MATDAEGPTCGVQWNFEKVPITNQIAAKGLTRRIRLDTVQCVGQFWSRSPEIAHCRRTAR